jgi:hypothetical protein
MKIFLVFIIISNILNSEQEIIPNINEKIIVHYVPWRAHFRGAIYEYDIKYMNNGLINHDTIRNDSIIKLIENQLKTLEIEDSYKLYPEVDLRMVCELYRNDSTVLLFSFSPGKELVRMNSKIYYSTSVLLKLIEGNIKPAQARFDK